MKYSHPAYRRMIRIDQRIREKKYPNCSAIAREFEVNPKTIARDIEFMRDQLHAPIEFDKRKNGYYYTEPNFFLPAILFKESDILSFIINERILSQYEDTPYYEAIQTAVEQVLQYIPNDMFPEINGNFVSFHPMPSSQIENHYFDIIQQSILNKHQLKIKYHSQFRNEDTDRLVDPYLLHNHYGNWYMVAHCHWRNEVRIFALNRIMTIEPTEHGFERPKDFSIEQLLKHSFNLICGGETFHVVLKFSPFQARWIRERQWHKTQKLTELEDGSLILEMDVQGLSDVKRWVMQYGGEVEVVEPKVLREDVLREIEKMSLLYNS